MSRLATTSVMTLMHGAGRPSLASRSAMLATMSACWALRREHGTAQRGKGGHLIAALVPEAVRLDVQADVVTRAERHRERAHQHVPALALLPLRARHMRTQLRWSTAGPHLEDGQEVEAAPASQRRRRDRVRVKEIRVDPLWQAEQLGPVFDVARFRITS